jgi:predicted permease
MTILDIVLPVFLVIALGCALRWRGFIGEETNAWLSRLVFYVAAPALLFRATAQGGFDLGTRLPVLLVAGGATALVSIGVYVAARGMAPARRGVLAQGCHRSNTVFIGLPIVLNAFGDAALRPASILIAFMVVVENLLAVLVLTLPHRRLSARDPKLWLQTAARIARNPLIIACAAGVLCSLLGLRLPTALDRSLELMGRTAAPLGLLCVGAGLQFARLRSEIPGTALVSVVRLLIHPALIFLALRRLGFAGLELAVPVLVMACPTAVVSYIMAREMEGDANFAGAIIIGTTVAGIATLVVWLAVLRVG